MASATRPLGLAWRCLILAAAWASLASFGVPLAAATSGPVVSSSFPVALAAGSIRMGGTVTTEAEADAYFVYSVDPAFADAQTTPVQVVPAGSTGLVLSADISGYVPGSVVYYYLRASNVYGSANGATYGAVMPTAPTATTDPPTDVTATSLRLQATFQRFGQAGTFSFQWGTDGNMTHTTASSVASDGPNNYIGLVDLPPGATITYRVIMTTNAGTAVGGTETAALNIPLPNGTSAPDISVLDPTSIASTGTVAQALVRTYGETTAVHAEWGLASGSIDHLTPTVTTGPSTGLSQVAVPISGLSPDENYQFRIVATNEEGTTTSQTSEFTTLGAPPEASLPTVLVVTPTTATLSALVDPLGADTSVHVEWGPTDQLGVASAPLDAGSATVAYPLASVLSGLLPDHDYWARFVATNASGSSTTSTIAFHTLADVTASPPAIPVPPTPAPPSATADATLASTAVTPSPADVLAVPPSSAGTDAPAIVTTQLVTSRTGEATITIWVRTGAAAVVRLDFGRTRRYGSGETRSIARSGRVQLRLTGLIGSATYHYRVSVSSPTGSTTTVDTTLRTPSDPPRATRVPRLVGRPRVGHILTCLPGSWNAATRLTITWLRDGRPILSSGRPGHTVSPEDRGSALLCEVHAHGAGGVRVARSDTLRIPARP